MREIVQSSAVLQYAIQLEAEGYIDRLPGKPLAERHALLKEYVAAWHNLAWKHEVDFSAEGVLNIDQNLARIYGYKFSGGILTQSSWRFPEKIFFDEIAGRQFQRTCDLFPLTFEMDGDQNLLVLVEERPPKYVSTLLILIRFEFDAHRPK